MCWCLRGSSLPRALADDELETALSGARPCWLLCESQSDSNSDSKRTDPRATANGKPAETGLRWSRSRRRILSRTPRPRTRLFEWRARSRRRRRCHVICIECWAVLYGTDITTYAADYRPQAIGGRSARVSGSPRPPRSCSRASPFSRPSRFRSGRRARLETAPAAAFAGLERSALCSRLGDTALDCFCRNDRCLSATRTVIQKLRHSALPMPLARCETL